MGASVRTFLNFFPVALLLLAGFVLPLLAQHYAWEVVYTIEPLTEHIVVLVSTTGATSCESREVARTFAYVLRPGSFIVEVEQLSPEQAQGLKDAFTDLSIEVEFWKDGLPYRPEDWPHFVVVEDGVVYSPLPESISLEAGDYDVVIKAEYATVAVPSAEEGEFDMLVHMVLAQ